MKIPKLWEFKNIQKTLIEWLLSARDRVGSKSDMVLSPAEFRKGRYQKKKKSNNMHDECSEGEVEKALAV